MKMRSSSVSSVLQPQSVPLRVSVVLVEETEVWGAECLVSPALRIRLCDGRSG